MAQAIITQNPIFTKLLAEQEDEGEVRKRWALYSTADDIIPYDEFPAHTAFQQEYITVEATDVLSPDDENNNPENWPHPMARPMLAVDSGVIPVFKL